MLVPNNAEELTRVSETVRRFRFVKMQRTLFHSVVCKIFVKFLCNDSHKCLETVYLDTVYIYLGTVLSVPTKYRNGQ